VSLLLAKGSPEQLELVDAWDRTLELLERGNFRNRRWKVSEILQPGEIPPDSYDFIYAFSTSRTSTRPPPGRTAARCRWHAATRHRVLHGAPARLRPAVVAANHLDELQQSIETLLESGFWLVPTSRFVATPADTGEQGIFGHAVVMAEPCTRSAPSLGTLRYLGKLQAQCSTSGS
jgi:hypothetical protein